MTEQPTAAEPLDPDSADDIRDFDVDAWLDDARPPQRSMVVYKRADLYARLDELERQSRLSGESSIQDHAEWQKIAQHIADSAVTITVRALTDDTAKQARAAAKKEDIKARARQEWDDEDMAADVVAAAEDEAEIDDLDDEAREALIRRRVVEARRVYINARYAEAVGEHALVRTLVSPKMTIGQVRQLSEQIGSAQRDRLIALYQNATADVRPVTAPFSPPSSPGRHGGTSSKRSGRRTAGKSRR